MWLCFAHKWWSVLVNEWTSLMAVLSAAIRSHWATWSVRNSPSKRCRRQLSSRRSDQIYFQVRGFLSSLADLFFVLNCVGKTCCCQFSPEMTQVLFKWYAFDFDFWKNLFQSPEQNKVVRTCCLCVIHACCVCVLYMRVVCVRAHVVWRVVDPALMNWWALYSCLTPFLRFFALFCSSELFKTKCSI